MGQREYRNGQESLASKSAKDRRYSGPGICFFAFGSRDGPVLAEVWIIQTTELFLVIMFVFLSVGQINPMERLHKPVRSGSAGSDRQEAGLGFVQVIQRRHHVAHQYHEKERDLKNIFRDEIETIDKRLVPRDRVQGDDKRQQPN